MTSLPTRRRALKRVSTSTCLLLTFAFALPAEAVEPAGASAYSPERVAALVAEANAKGDLGRGAEVFLDAKFACISCHKVGHQGGEVGPELTSAGVCIKPEAIVEAILWPKRQVKEGFSAIVVARNDGKIVQGYRIGETPKELTLREATTGHRITIAKDAIEEQREAGTLMPEGLAEAMTAEQRRDLIRFVMSLGRSTEHGRTADLVMHHSHGPASFPYDRTPLRPEEWPHWQHHVNRNRLYDFYAKEAEYFVKQPILPSLLPGYPGLDGGTFGHWGNQDETTWADDRWNQTELGTLLGGIFRAAGVTVPKGVCVRLGDRGEMAACFNPETLCYEAVWQGGFVKFSSVRHGFMSGLNPVGKLQPRPEGAKPKEPFVYHGFYRHGPRVIFSYRIGDVELLDAPWVEDGKFTRTVAPVDKHPLASWIRGGPAQWPQVLTTKGTRGKARPYALDTIEPPFENPWKALMFFGDHDFLSDGTALVATMQGDVWRVEGLDDDLKAVRWRRFASGLHHALGLLVHDGHIYVLGRDQITELHDRNGDGEADFYECFSNAYTTSPAGHDFICGLQRDKEGRFYTVTGNQGLLRISADGKSVEVLATGFRNADGVGLTPEGAPTVPSSEGEWTPASQVCEVRPGGHYGYGGPKNGKTPDLPLVYLPRGLDNSSGSQVAVTSKRFGPLEGQMIHFSFGAGSAFLLLREQVDGQPQGAAVPLPGEYLSGAHRGRFSPKDGQLYVSGMSGWGTYTVADGSFQRLRYTGDPVQLPLAFHARQNGVLVTFTGPIDRSIAEQAKNQFAQVWNYRYGASYGSLEFSTRHPGVAGHDPLRVASAHVLDDGRTLFLELPDLQPVSQLHLHLRVDGGRPHDLFATVHKLGAPFTGFPGYQPVEKTIAAHPMLTDLAMASHTVPNLHRRKIPKARPVEIAAGPNLTYTVTSFKVRAGEPIALTFANPDVVPHNWALIKAGTLPKVGELANKLVAEPDALARHYIPKTDDVLAYTDLVYPQDRYTIYFHAPKTPGRYPYLCTFPGHWLAMNGVMIVVP